LSKPAIPEGKKEGRPVSGGRAHETILGPAQWWVGLEWYSEKKFRKNGCRGVSKGEGSTFEEDQTTLACNRDWARKWEAMEVRKKKDACTMGGIK